MKRFIMIAFALSLMLQGCNGQEKSKQQERVSNKPQTNIKVNKEYDNDGNLVRYDSTYSYYYSNVESDSIIEDSILRLFKNQLNQKYLFSNEPYFNDLFFEDSLLKYDFYKQGFFSNRFRENMRRMDSLFMQMDDMKDAFFRQQKPHKKQAEQ